MEASKNPRTNKIMRVLGTVIGLGAAAVWLYTQFGPASLPDCDRSEVRTALQQLVDGPAGGQPAGAASTLEQISESGHDEAKEIRSCTAVAKFADGSQEKLDYTVAWTDKDERRFEVAAEMLPRCNRSEVQETVRSVIADLEKAGQPPRTLAAVEQIADGGLDTTGAQRSCTALARFDGGTEQKLSYTVKWNDPERTQFAVQLTYQP